MHNVVGELSRKPLTRADIKNPHNSIAIAGIAYLSTELDADITGGVDEIWTRGLQRDKLMC